MRFCGEAADFGAERRPAGSAGLRDDFGAGDQFVESRAGFGSVRLLCSVDARCDDQHAVLRGATAGQCEEALAHGGRKRRGVGGIPAQLHGSGYLVYVLAAGTGRANKGLGDFGIRNDYGQSYFQNSPLPEEGLHFLVLQDLHRRRRGSVALLDRQECLLGPGDHRARDVVLVDRVVLGR